MPQAAENLFADVLSLPVEIRLQLVEALLTSLNPPVWPEVDRLWAEEAERRVAQIDAGEAALVPGEAVFARIREKYGR